MLKQKPAFTFNPAFTATEFKKWQLGLCSTMKELIRFPEVKDQPAPVRIKMVQRDGYRVEKWESYPLPGSVVPYLVLIPDGIDTTQDRCLLCFVYRVLVAVKRNWRVRRRVITV